MKKKKAPESVKKESTEVETKLEGLEDSGHSAHEAGELESKKKLYGLGQKFFVITIVATATVFVAWLLTT